MLEVRGDVARDRVAYECDDSDAPVSVNDVSPESQTEAIMRWHGRNVPPERSARLAHLVKMAGIHPMYVKNRQPSPVECGHHRARADFCHLIDDDRHDVEWAP